MLHPLLYLGNSSCLFLLLPFPCVSVSRTVKLAHAQKHTLLTKHRRCRVYFQFAWRSWYIKKSDTVCATWRVKYKTISSSLTSHSMAVADKLNKGERQRTWKACLTSAALYTVAWHIVVVATVLNAYVRWHQRRSHVDVCDVNLREIAGLNVHVRGLFGSGLRFNKQNHLPGYHIVGRCYRNFTFLLLWQRNLKNTGTPPVHFGSTFWPWKNLQVSLNVKQYHCQQKWNWMHKQLFSRE